MINFGGILSTLLYNDAPRFRKAISINLAFSLGIAVSSAGLVFYFRARNAEKRRKIQDLLQSGREGTEDWGWDSPEERRRLGDRHPRFEYTTYNFFHRSVTTMGDYM